ncbi:hypothetical protein K438DRAFT_1907101 [Mycena galopus ATCC 62051]|nr:hypothetical protein K438DRAFT_1907101 [Mycena galopus ATCC 62051]
MLLSSSTPLLITLFFPRQAYSKCRNIPGSTGFPDAEAWRAFNATVSGHLVPVVPSAKYCESLPGGACTDAQWSSALFRSTIPGAMNQVNFEQGYDLTPPSLCFRNSTMCGQGDVPLYAAAVVFSSSNNLRLVVKSSGHDYLGRSTAPNSLLIHMAKLTDVIFNDTFMVGAENMGSTVTVGPGVNLQDIYNQTKAQGKIAVGGSAATVCAAGGYLQGAGHSALSPLLGLSADNVLEFQIVVASGALLKVNSESNSDLFYALRGGGAGSWGVIVSATLRTFPTFNVTGSDIELAASTNAAAAALAGVHAKHIFDLDPVHGGQYFYLETNGNLLIFSAKTIMPNTTADDSVGMNIVMGSRLIPATAYQAANASAAVEQMTDSLPGQVSANANISSAVNPAWRTAKTHLILVNGGWNDSTSIADIDTIRHSFQTTQRAIIEQLSGPDAGSYSNEADLFEPEYQTTFYGPNYAKLSAIKSKYDPDDLFIVASGVGSERWDEWGICTV